MNRRYKILVLGLLACVVVVVVVLAMLASHQSVLLANYERVEKGMTPEQVKNIFGEEPNGGILRKPKYDTMSWTDHENIVTIVFALDAQGSRAAAKGYRHVSSDDFFKRMFEWLHPEQMISWE